jgi:hypothetical protein
VIFFTLSLLSIISNATNTNTILCPYIVTKVGYLMQHSLVTGNKTARSELQEHTKQQLQQQQIYNYKCTSFWSTHSQLLRSVPTLT